MQSTHILMKKIFSPCEISKTKHTIIMQQTHQNMMKKKSLKYAEFMILFLLIWKIKRNE